MNTSAAIVSTQMFIVWTLLGVLVAWTFLCIFLALRPLRTRKPGAMDLSTPSGVFPVLVSPLPLRLAAVPVEKSLATVSMVSPEPVGDVGSAPVA